MNIIPYSAPLCNLDPEKIKRLDLSAAPCPGLFNTAQLAQKLGVAPGVVRHWYKRVPGQSRRCDRFNT
jgi:hypothetical protein